MSKSVLVINTPECCRKCTFALIGEYRRKEFTICRVDKAPGRQNERPETIPVWCPLMDLPEKDAGDYPTNTFDAAYAEGWNACIDEIAGENDG